MLPWIWSRIPSLGFERKVVPMSVERIVPGVSCTGLAGLAMALCLGFAASAFGADFDKKPTAFTIVGPSAKDALSDAPPVVSSAPSVPAGTAGKSLPQGLPNPSAPTAKSVVTVENLPPPPGPLGMKTPRPVVDATHQKPDYYPLLPGIYGRPDDNVGMVLGVVLPITAGDK